MMIHKGSLILSPNYDGSEQASSRTDYLNPDPTRFILSRTVLLMKKKPSFEKQTQTLLKEIRYLKTHKIRKKEQKFSGIEDIRYDKRSRNGEEQRGSNLRAQ